MEMPVWELRVKRLGLQSRPGERVRTYGAYDVFIGGDAVPGLSGHVCECTGRGDNTVHGKNHHLRIEEGRYALSTQFGPLYRSAGFTNDTTHPLPGFLLLGTEVRTGILVHPGHPPTLYLSSIGCFNPTNPLRADQDMDFTDSRKRVIALIDSLKMQDPAAFAHDRIGHDTAIQNAFMAVDGEPMDPVSDDVIV
jgi:hypothetical protein